MFHFKKNILFLICCWPMFIFAAPSNSIKVKQVTSSQFSKIQLWYGVGFVHWNEPLLLRRLNEESEGVANYAGPMACIEANVYKKRWLYGIALSFSAGTASAGQISGVLKFDDGKNRAWYGSDLTTFSNYRFNKQVQFGLGFVSKVRLANWEPEDKTLTIITKKPLEFGPSVNLRILLNADLQLQQTYLLLGPKSNQWTMFISKKF